jgi:hypothetical protein
MEQIKSKKKLKITKEQHDKVKEEYLADVKKDKAQGKKSKSFNSFFSFSKRGVMNKSLKSPNEILAFVLSLKKTIEGPVLTKIYGGNFLVIKNRVYRFNPDRVFSFGKYKAVIVREFDRELVGIDDYQELVLKDYLSRNPGARVNIDDPVLIKALIQAKLGERPQMGSPGKMIVIGLIVLGLVIGFFWLTGKGG